VQNSNDSAWMTNAASPLAGFPQMISKEGEELQGRTRMGIDQIEARMAGNDGRPGNGFTLEQLQHVSFNNRVFYASLVRGELNALCHEPGTVTVEGAEVLLGDACATFRAWDGTANADSVGYPLFGLWWDRLEDNKAIWSAPDRQVENHPIWAVPFSADDPVNTPRGLRTDDPVVAAFARESLGAAILELKKRGIDWKKPWGEIQYVEAKGKRVPVPGGASGDVYNIMYSVPAEPGRMVVKLGSSYVQTVGFDDDGPVADAILTYSQSSNPDSPHHGDQIGLFSAGKWVRQPFTEAQIQADPAYRTMTVSE
jgi:acyl-homoserine-lactone acylase